MRERAEYWYGKRYSKTIISALYFYKYLEKQKSTLVTRGEASPSRLQKDVQTQQLPDRDEE